MTYIFDTGPISTLFRNFYKSVFPTLWGNFDALVDGGSILSVKEASKELEGQSPAGVQAWVKDNSHIFHPPTAEEAAFIAQIYAIPHFLQNISAQQLLKGGYAADPYIIAKAKIEGKTVVTTELYKPNSAKIPNICQHFGVNCMTLQNFMEAEGWKF